MSDEHEYMTTVQVAEYLRITTGTISSMLKNQRIPEPDLVYRGRNLWLQKTIDAWYDKRERDRAGKGGPRLRGRMLSAKTTRLSYLDTLPEPPTPPRGPRAKPAPSIEAFAKPVPVEAAPPPTSVDLPAAMEIAFQLRGDGYFIQSRDVIQLAASSHEALDWPAQGMRARVMERLRTLKPPAA